MINRVSKKYIKNIENLTLEQKQMIVDVLVDKIYIKKESNKDVKIQVMFKFDLDKLEKIDNKDELKNSTSTSKSNGAINVSNVNGGSSGARTQDLLLKRELLYQLS